MPHVRGTEHVNVWLVWCVVEAEVTYAQVNYQNKDEYKQGKMYIHLHPLSIHKASLPFTMHIFIEKLWENIAAAIIQPCYRLREETTYGESTCLKNKR